jgi:MFS transporter, DHA1 family, multidrug resistance protein
MLRPDTLGMTAVLAMLTAIGPLSTDMYLPSLPSIASAFAADASRVQLTLSIYLVGFAMGQIFYGPISDKFGRKPAVLTGLLLYAVASAGCALATSIDMLVFFRFVQALGAAGPIVLARAIVRDLYDGARAGRELSRMGMIMGIVPALAPIIGGVMEPLFGWRSNFWAVLLAAGALAWVVSRHLPETLRARRLEPISFISILRGFGALLSHRGYRLYVTVSGLTYGGLFCFISGSSFVLQQTYGLSPLLFGLSFAVSVLGFITGTVIAQRVVGRLGLDGTIRIGVWLLALGGALMLTAMAYGPGWFGEVTLPMALYTMGVGLVLPQSSASSMMPFPDRAGAASSLLGLIQMSFAAGVGALLGTVLMKSPLLMPLFITVLGGATLLVFGMARGFQRPA